MGVDGAGWMLVAAAALLIVAAMVLAHYSLFWYRVRQGVPVDAVPVSYPFGNFVTLVRKGSLHLVEQLQGTAFINLQRRRTLPIAAAREMTLEIMQLREISLLLTVISTVLLAIARLRLHVCRGPTLQTTSRKIRMVQRACGLAADKIWSFPATRM